MGSEEMPFPCFSYGKKYEAMMGKSLLNATGVRKLGQFVFWSETPVDFLKYRLEGFLHQENQFTISHGSQHCVAMFGNLIGDSVGSFPK